MHLSPYEEAVHIRQPTRYFPAAQICGVPFEVTTLHINNRPTFTPDARCKTQDYIARMWHDNTASHSRRPSCASAALPSAAPLHHQMTCWNESPGFYLDSPVLSFCYCRLEACRSRYLARSHSQWYGPISAGRLLYVVLVLTPHNSVTPYTTIAMQARHSYCMRRRKTNT